MIYRYLFMFFCCYISFIQVYAQELNTQIFSNQTQETGLPFIQNYAPYDYDAGSQNWTIVQSKEGFMYFGNNDGVLEYDGVSWRLISLPNLNIVRSLAITKNNKIYVGGFNELGYLEADSQSKLQFISLKSYLPKANQEFQDILSIHSIDNAIYFQSKEQIFKWSSGKFKALEAKKGFNFSKTIRNELYAIESNTILQKLVNGKFKDIVNASHVNAKVIVDVLEYKESQLLVLTLEKGLFILENGTLKPFNIEGNKFLIKKLGRKIIKLSNGRYLIATYKGGVALFDSNGNFIKALDKTDGLLESRIYSLYEDRQKGIWLAANYGISRVELLSPYTIFDDRQGINGYVNRVFRHDNKLYIANNNGVLKLIADNNLKNSNTFKVIDESSFSGVNGSVQAYYFMAINDSLFSASRAGVHIIVNQEVTHTFNYKASALMRSKKDPNLIFIGLDDGLAYLKYSNQKWLDAGRINGIKDDIREIVEDKNGNLWLESQVDGVWKVDFSKSFHKPKIKHFIANKELPKGVLFLKFVRGEVLFTINNHVYKYNEQLDSIVPNPSFGKIFGLSGEISVKKEDKNGDIWMFAQFKKEDKRLFRVRAIKRSNNTYNVKKIIDERVIAFNVGTAHFTDKNNIVWYGGSDGVIRHDLNIKSTAEIDFNTHIREVLIQNDSLLFSGAKTVVKNTLIPFKGNAFRFEYAATSFDAESQNKFQYQLEGFDKEWSKWTSETKKDYTNIPEGDYSFKVRSKNIFNHIGKEDSYSFTILPPWYRTWWMYLMYGIATIGVILLIIRWKSHQLLKKNIALEKVIKERTSQIIKKNNQLKDQTEQLKVVDKMKTRLFANISHEFRTPLTLIKGPIEELERYPEKKLSVSNVKMIRRNANRLLKLVNQLLDLSKLESGNLTLEPSEGNVYKSIRAAASSFSSHAAQRNMDYQIKIPSHKILWASFDRDRLDKIVYNLLSNAFKFTDDDGMVSISVKFSNEELKIEVSDSGCGIPPDRLPLIFDRFFQVDDSFTKEKAGTGIGLSLTKELVELMQGTIHVESDYKKGSVFKIMIPLEEIKTSQKEDKQDKYEIKRTFVVKEERVHSVKLKNKNLRTILIVEDNKDMRDFIKQQLEEEYQIIEAYNGQDGLEKALKRMPDLIITDLMMPKMDGISLCKQLRKEINTSHIPIIMLTAKAGIENKIEGLDTGADAYLTKPFNSKELHVRIKNLIKQRQKLRELFSKKDIVHPKEVTVTSLDEQFLQKIIDLLEEQYSNSNFAIPQMREELAMSNAQLHRKVKALTNHSPGELLRNFRLKRAAQILKQKGAYVTEVAYDVGFNNLSYFAKCFKKFHGVSPSVFSKKNSNS